MLFPRDSTGQFNPGCSMKTIVCDDDYKPLIPDGEYIAQCIGYDSQFLFGKTRKTFLYFKILSEGKYFGIKLFMAFNMPYNGRIKTGSKFYKTWCMVNDWRRPSRNTKMSPRLFKNKIYTIKTRTVRPKHNDQPMPDQYLYSIVDKILKVNAG